MSVAMPLLQRLCGKMEAGKRRGGKVEAGRMKVGKQQVQTAVELRWVTTRLLQRAVIDQ